MATKGVVRGGKKPKTVYKGPERASGDRLKVILLQMYDMSFKDNLQIYEIISLLRVMIKKLKKTPGRQGKDRRPRNNIDYACPGCGEDSCGDDAHTVTPYRGPEVSLGMRLLVVEEQVRDLMEIDGLPPKSVLSLVTALLTEHVHEEDLLQVGKDGR